MIVNNDPTRVEVTLHNEGSDETQTYSFPKVDGFEMYLETGTFGETARLKFSQNSIASLGTDGYYVKVYKSPTPEFEVSNVLTGADFTPRVPNAEATPEQLWGELLLLSPEERNKRLQGFIDSSQPPLFDYNQKQADIESGNIAELWRFGNSKFSSYSGAYEARRDNIKETWPELAEAVDRLSRVR